MAQKRVHILSAVNAGAVSKSGSTYTIKDVCGAVDGIVMNRKLYPADSLARGAPSLEGKPAPAGHPKNASGQFISALNGAALADAWIGSYANNARHEGGRTLTDIIVNEAQARAHPLGVKLLARLDAAIDGTNQSPIHVSTGLFHESVAANGESGGKAYDTVVTNIRYDHLAILVDGNGAATPADGVGMFLNEAGQEEEVDTVTVNANTEDRRTTGLRRHLSRLLGNKSGDLSFDDISSRLYKLIGEGCWLREVFDKYAIWCDAENRMWRQDYAVASDGSVAFLGSAVEVARKVSYEPITNRKDDHVKEQLIAALNAAGISGAAAMTDAQLLDAYNHLQAKPHTEALAAANGKVATFEAAERAAADAEINTLATELATNSVLKADDFKAMGLARCRELKVNAKAAPIVPSGSGSAGEDPYASYSINEITKQQEVA